MAVGGCGWLWLSNGSLVNRFSIPMSGLLSDIQASLKRIARFQNKQNADHAPHPSDESRDQVELAEEHELEVVVGHFSTTSESDSPSETEEESPSSSLSQNSSQNSPSDSRNHDGFWTSSLKSNDLGSFIYFSQGWISKKLNVT